MSGHNKWSKIKHKKASTDAKKSQVFARIVKLISTESKKARGDMGAPGLRMAIEKARAANMPSENIERAIAKGKTDTSAPLEPVLYEAYGVGGSAILIEGLTDNKNRTAAEVKHILSKFGASLAAPGAAQWAFKKDETGAYSPESPLPLPDEERERLAALIDALEEQEDIQSIATNASL